MNIFFTASLRAKRQLEDHYQAIISVLRKKNTVYAEHIVTLEVPQVEDWDPEYHFEYYQSVLAMIKQADVLVAEISNNSINVAYEINVALSQRKPVIAMYVQGAQSQLVSQIDERLTEERLWVLEYRMADLQPELERILEEARKQITQRFTLLLPTHIVNYLDDLAVETGVPRAVYIRHLIEKDMSR